MNDSELERLRSKLGGGPVAPPPPDLLDRLKSDIPDLTSGRGQRSTTGFGEHPAAWRLAASVIMLFGFAYAGARIYLEGRADQFASVAPTSATYDRAAETAQIAQADDTPSVGLSSPPASPPPPMQTRVTSGQGPAATSARTAADGQARVANEAMQMTSPQKATSDDFAAEPESIEQPAKAGSADDERIYIEDAMQETATERVTVVAAAPAPAPPQASMTSAPAPPPPPGSAGARRDAEADASSGLQREKKSERERLQLAVDKDDLSTDINRIDAEVTVGADGKVSNVRFLTKIPATLRPRVERLIRARTYPARSAVLRETVEVTLKE